MRCQSLADFNQSASFTVVNKKKIRDVKRTRRLHSCSGSVSLAPSLLLITLLVKMGMPSEHLGFGV
uniref:Uncharacterized protein n=1 Tax=Anguilla anguilla TaxID=7936 RepID=A0A0E9Q178_ANGAN